MHGQASNGPLVVRPQMSCVWAGLEGDVCGQTLNELGVGTQMNHVWMGLRGCVGGRSRNEPWEGWASNKPWCEVDFK